MPLTVELAGCYPPYLPLRLSKSFFVLSPAFANILQRKMVVPRTTTSDRRCFPLHNPCAHEYEYTLMSVNFDTNSGVLSLGLFDAMIS